jgi:hypothetical protein
MVRRTTSLSLDEYTFQSSLMERHFVNSLFTCGVQCAI